MTKSFTIYNISRGYTQCAVWYADETHVRVRQSTLTPFKNLTRRQRYDEIAKFLETCKLPVPPYRPTTREIRGDKEPL